MASRLLTFKVGAPEAVTVPAGTFQGFRIDVTRLTGAVYEYVGTDAPDAFSKEFVGQPFVVELVSNSGIRRTPACVIVVSATRVRRQSRGERYTLGLGRMLGCVGTSACAGAPTRIWMCR